MGRAGRGNLAVGVAGLAACAAVNVWIFRYGLILGLVGLNLTKHVGVAVLCQALGVNRTPPAPLHRRRSTRHPAHRPLAGPHPPARAAR